MHAVLTLEDYYWELPVEVQMSIYIAVRLFMEGDTTLSDSIKDTAIGMELTSKTTGPLGLWMRAVLEANCKVSALGTTRNDIMNVQAYKVKCLAVFLTNPFN